MSRNQADLEYLLEQAKRAKMTAKQKEEQRRSFAYGNTNIENQHVTRRIVEEEAEKLPSANVR